ncbi:type II toxin-antitoxin system Phd/YefM family antitoxin [Agilicoccus flavus]|uniref:type II toxin-antitoxin system Phd/YefM family antitoxin n=1 Tax=Agilicoccus flavus TaxID=2775968 RepID=UPI001CF6C162|nr:type II toxin-antitoxin system prevent-host-death family antitoxin [Agilicoccus flavus]
MDTVSKRDLNQQTAVVLERVARTGDVVVTERGEPRWRLIPFRAGQESTLARLERDGGYEPPAAEPAPWPDHPGGPRLTDAEAEVLLDEMRGDH